MLGMAKVVNPSKKFRARAHQILQGLRVAHIVRKFHLARENPQSKRSDLRAKSVDGRARCDHPYRALEQLLRYRCAGNARSYLYRRYEWLRLEQLKLVRHNVRNGCATYASSLAQLRAVRSPFQTLKSGHQFRAALNIHQVRSHLVVQPMKRSKQNMVPDLTHLARGNTSPLTYKPSMR